jgi:hypothetical protein
LLLARERRRPLVAIRQTCGEIVYTLLAPKARFANQKARMKLTERFSVLAVLLVMSGLCVSGAWASAEEASSKDAATLLTDAPVAAAALPQPELPDDPGAGLQTAGQTTATPPATAAKPAATTGDPLSQGRQTKRILFIVPNFRAVSADQHLPPQTVKEKAKTTFLDSLDYSSLIFVGVQAGIGQATDSYPVFRQGAKGYGRYYWHTLADAINENTWVEFIIPSILHQDTRYYTLGKGPFAKRVLYAATRVVITKTDSGKKAFNFSEVGGAGAFAGVANLYYPHEERTFTKTYQRWITNLGIDGGVFIFKEIWPDINNALFHQKD